jgi:CheY-like chemotaxis protein
MPKSILLADDSLTIQKVIELTFSDTDYDLTTVGNGLEAIAAIQRSRPDLVMADVVMPGKNGYEVCETIKTNPSLADIPVILLSGTFEPFDRERAERAKANAIVTKPFDSKNLLSQVESLLGSRSSPTTVAVPVPPVTQSTLAIPTEPPPAETIQIPTNFGLSEVPPAPGGEFRPPWMGTKSVAEISEMTFDGSFSPEDVPGEPAPPSGEPASEAPRRKVEPVEFDMEDSSPFGKPVPATPFAQERPLQEVFSPFPERDNVFEFPAPEPTALSASPEAAAQAPSVSTPPPPETEEATEEVEQAPPLAALSEEDFPPEPVFLKPTIGEPEPLAEAAVPGASVGSEIESLAQRASISDLASLVSRMSPASISEEDVERIARRVVEMLSEKAVRDIAWEVVPDMAEIAVRKRLRELEAEPGESD